MVDITPGRAYVLVSKKTHQALHSPNGGDRTLNQDDPTKSTADRNYHWLLYPADSEGTWWWVVSRAWGLMMYVQEAVKGDRIRQGDPNLDNERYKWKLERTDGDYHRIRLMSNDMAVHAVEDKSGGIGSLVNLDDAGADQLEWKVEVAKEFEPITSLKPAGQHPDFGDIDHLTSLAEPREHTDPVLVGSVALPFFVVDDNKQKGQWKVAHSPYYILSRYSSWSRQHFEVFEGHEEITRIYTTDVGLVTSNSKEVEKTVGISVTAEAGFSYLGATAKISATVTAGLRVKEDSSTTVTHTREDKQQEVAPAGDHYAYALWYRQDTYRVSRLVVDAHGNDTSEVILEWSTLDPESVVRDSYPPK